MSIAQKCDLNPKYYNIRKAFGIHDSTPQQSSSDSNYYQKPERLCSTYCEFFLLFKTSRFDKRKNNHAHGFNFSQPVNYASL